MTKELPKRALSRHALSELVKDILTREGYGFVHQPRFYSFLVQLPLSSRQIGIVCGALMESYNTIVGRVKELKSRDNIELVGIVVVRENLPSSAVDLRKIKKTYKVDFDV